MRKIAIITRLTIIMEAARLDGNKRRAARCFEALRLLGAA